MSHRSPLRASILLLTLAVVANGQGSLSSSSEVRDEADVFGVDAVRKGIEKVIAIERKYRVPVTIETVASLKGEPIRDATLRYAKRMGPQGKGIFILIAKLDRKIEVVASKEFPELESRNRTLPIRDAFLEEFRKGEFDAGLSKGLEAVEKTLATVKAATPLNKPSMPEPEKGSTIVIAPKPTAAPAEGTPKVDPTGLVHRDAIKLTLEGARRVIAGAEAKAKESVFKMNIAVVDDGGHLLAFVRMDGARPASAASALTKAISAATYRQPTGPLPVGSATPDVLLSLSLQNAMAASGGKVTTLLGGLPIMVDGQVVGAIGVGGGTGEQDTEVAKAGLAAFLADLQAGSKASK